MAGGLEQGGWGLGRVSQGLGGWVLEGAEGLGLGGGAGPSGDRTDVYSLARSTGNLKKKRFFPLFQFLSGPVCNHGSVRYNVIPLY